MGLVDEAYERAFKVLKMNSTELGFKASYDYYNSVWARDGAITCMAALMLGDEELTATCRRTLETLRQFQSKIGQVATVHYLDKPMTYWGGVDSTLWYIIACWHYYEATKDNGFLKQFWPSIREAMRWALYQDNMNCNLVVSLEAGDWMDASLQRTGLVFYNNCLFYEAARRASQLAKESGEEPLIDAEDVKERVNIVFWPVKGYKEELLPLRWAQGAYEEAVNPKRRHYLNYISFERYDGRCDVLAQVLAVIWEIADEDKTRRIIDYLVEEEVSTPYPAKALNPPIFVPDYTWKPQMDLYRPRNWQNLPFCYHNAGVWPYVGGFYILALLIAGRRDLAEAELERLALANKRGKVDWEFNEWLHGKTGEPMGARLQSWSAAGYIMAHKAVKDGEALRGMGPM